MAETEDLQSPCVSFLKEQESDCLHCAVRNSALFSELAPDDLDQRLKTIHNGLVRADTVIYRQGQEADAVFTLRNGLVKLIAGADTATSRIVRVLGRGAAVGLESASGGTYEHTAIALRDLNLCRIPRAVLLALGEQHPGLLAGLVSKWREHALLADRWISTICVGKQKGKEIALIRLLIEISGDPIDTVRLPRTADMAAILGCSPEGVSRRMAKLKRQGLLRRVAPWTYQCDPSLIAGASDSSSD